MKKNILAAFGALLLGAGATALFSYAFPPWKFALYGVSAVLMGLSAGCFGFLYGKAKNDRRPLVRGLILGVSFLAFTFVLVYVINNVIYQAHQSTKAALIIAAVVSVFYTLCFVAVAVKNGKKVFPAVLALLLTAAIGYAPIVPSVTKTYLKEHPKHISVPAATSQYTEYERTTVMNADFYVAPDGDDKNDGSAEKPFLTIEKARDAVRGLDKKGRKGITVAVKAGEYRVDCIEFTEEDSGTKECPVTYRAYGDGEVILNGGITLVPESFVPVTDEAVLSRLSADAGKNVRAADLTQFGLTSDDWGKIYAIGSYNTAAKYDGDYVGGIYCELFINDRRQVLARYPNEGYLYTEKVLETGYGRESDGALTARENWDEVRNPASDVYEINKELASRIASWKTLDDVWMFGFWKYDWADASSLIGSFDAEKRTLSPKFVSTYGTKTDAPYYFFNVFEELDAPGEWYLDRENGIVYVYPDGDLTSASVDMSLTEQPVIRASGLNYVTFDGFTVKGTRGNAMELSGKGLTVSHCLIKNVAGSAIIVDGTDNLITENEITRTGMGGVSMNGGDRETLTPGNNKADNNLVHDWSEIYQTYQPAFSLGGVGNICSHNEMYNSPHEAITYGGNDHVIEYNLIHDVCLLTDDGGAIYAGRRWDCYGNVIRYNCIYDLGADGHRPCGIYMDDALSGQTIYGNLLVNVPSIALHLGGGRDLNVTNNIVVNCNDSSISYDDRAREGVFGGWFTHSSQQGGDMWTNLYDSPWQTDVWKNAYPQMQKFSDDFDNTDDPCFVPNPAFSDVTGNLIVNVLGDIGNISEAAARFSKVENNAVLKLSAAKKIFVDPDNGDYAVKEDSEVFRLIPDFEQIPVSDIGRY